MAPALEIQRVHSYSAKVWAWALEVLQPERPSTLAFVMIPGIGDG